MVRNLKVSIAEYLRTHKRLVVPQLGAFIVKAPGGEVLFSELFKRDDGVLRGLLTAGGASEIEAAGAIDRLIFDLRHAVQSGGRYTFEGIGTFSAGPNGALAFVGETPAGAAAESVPVPESRRRLRTRLPRPANRPRALPDRRCPMRAKASGGRVTSPIPA